ncbi:MAG: bifunctional [glutamine synthetase] adenylyltransferase/[glutamine synthetase]-adenylyl-L-tyrosine phosphorylase [Sphingomonadaceae bacterium]
MNATTAAPPAPAFSDALRRAREHSLFLALQAERFPAIAGALEREEWEEALRLAAGAGEGRDFGAALRRERSALALALAVGDLAGAVSLEQLMERLSDFADSAIARALRHVVAERVEAAPPAGFAILAVGKLGSRELNYSSDVDLLFLYDPGKLALKPREDPAEAAVRIGRGVIDLLQKRDEEGYVFRVDMRLRPSPEATPVALPVEAAISYYESQALPWERAVFIRARGVAGDAALSEYFLDAIHSFVWRRTLDFGAMDEIQTMSGRIRDHYAQGQGFGPGYDLKRGRGGIREVEFFAQAHQLIHGGREPRLRAPATLDALAALAKAGHIPSAKARVLASAYRLLRTVEHRLQMVDDRQTHRLPEARPALDGVARLHGLEDGAALLDLLRPEVGEVAEIYDELGGGEGKSLPRNPDLLEAHLAALGFDNAAGAAARVESWRSGKARSLRSAAAREAFESMLPGLLEAFGAAPNPATAINRFDDLVTRLPSAINFYRLIEARPALLELLALILSHAPALAEALARRPELLDGLIDASAFDPPPATGKLAPLFARREPGDDYQRLLDRARRRINERRFALGVQLIARRRDPLEVARGYARVAEAAVVALADATVAEFEGKHGRVPDAELVIVALGRLGGEAMTHASDLDLVYLFSGSHEAVSDGATPLGATDYFNRLAQRVSAALSVPTAAGALYEVDTRLRPSGKQGLLAVSIESFARYQRENAWTWEHMALARARPVYGSREARAAAEEEIGRILDLPRQRPQLIADAVAMRREMAAHKPASGRFDVKLGEGGLVDMEFAVHCLQLAHRTAFDPDLDEAVSQLAKQGLVEEELVGAHRLLTRLLVTLRLVSPASTEPPEASRPLVAEACGEDGWEDLLRAYDEARSLVSKLWRRVQGEAKEERE